MPNYVDIQLLNETRIRDDHLTICLCFICRSARDKRHAKTVTGKDGKKESTVMTIDHGLSAAKKTVGVK